MEELFISGSQVTILNVEAMNFLKLQVDLSKYLKVLHQYTNFYLSIWIELAVIEGEQKQRMQLNLHASGKTKDLTNPRVSLQKEIPGVLAEPIEASGRAELMLYQVVDKVVTFQMSRS